MNNVKIRLSREAVDDVLFRLRQAAWKMESSTTAEKAVDSIMWYVNTGRASKDFLEALIRCKPACLIKRIAPAWGCTASVIGETKRYLKIKEEL